MSTYFKSKNIYWILALALIIIDQCVKIYVKTHFYLGEEVVVVDNWFRLYFTENPGVAYGLEWGGEMGKYCLSIFRVLFSIGICIYLWKNIQAKASNLILISLTLILAGAIGNVIDGIFYGSIFSYSPHHVPVVANFVAFGEGYSRLLLGNVVDMFYFPLIHGKFPQWIPIIGGNYFSFFNAIFNVADACISIGLVVFLYYLNRVENKSKKV